MGTQDLLERLGVRAYPDLPLTPEPRVLQDRLEPLVPLVCLDLLQTLVRQVLWDQLGILVLQAYRGLL